MTTYVAAMPPQDFDLFGTANDQYADMIAATSQGFAMPNTFFENPFVTAMSTLDNIATLQAPEHLSRPEDYISATHALQMKHAYSPATSPPHHAYDAIVPGLSSASADAAAAAHSTSNSSLGSPSLQTQQNGHYHEPWGLALAHTVVPQQTYATASLEQDLEKQAGFVDPSLINPFSSPSLYPNATLDHIAAAVSPQPPFVEHPPSPAPSSGSSMSSTPADSRRFKPSGSQSPYLHAYTHQPYLQQYPGHRRSSQASIRSRHSQSSHRSCSYELDDEASSSRGLCPIPECGRVFKDLKAHMLTHQNERPEKCPIVTCEYHTKGFARKYDKNRHTLTHYKGTMVCGFCPGSGSAAEKSFNRADVFKRHLTSVHGVEQTPPNSRKKPPPGGKNRLGAMDGKPGICSTCSVTFANVQDFYEHLDDCVMRQVQQADPCEAINQKNLGSIQDDVMVQETLDRHNLPSGVDYNAPDSYDDVDEDDDSEEQAEADDFNDDSTGPSKNPKSGRGTLKSRGDGSS